MFVKHSPGNSRPDGFSSFDANERKSRRAGETSWVFRSSAREDSQESIGQAGERSIDSSGGG